MEGVRATIDASFGVMRFVCVEGKEERRKRRRQ